MKKLIEWSDALSVGIDELDAQHRVLVDLLNELHAAIEEHQASAAVEGILNRLSEYTRIHFAVEESLMRLLGYPDLKTHCDQHRALAAELQELRRKVEAGKLAIGFELMQLLRLWLTEHIMVSDQDYARFFASSDRAPVWRGRGWAWLRGKRGR